eukprot:TRINITY_DN27245_c0_g1_i2.p1 TRINITY_DN27245_c0_g1~~TRINITY_DN27245_c0_g1_i2.p1  ORF type:complete len:727 (+),score=148.78 TRINITY_DN27245_c0_g1_i2:123-2303(+)
MAPKNDGKNVSAFLGRAVARYDVDELDDLGKRQKRQGFVEVKRPDGSIAKSRGERTFYGAFEGGFSAGHWNTVGSKEGWTPASFTSSRSKRSADAGLLVEDLMDEEDLRDHRASHRTIASQGEFQSRETRMRARDSDGAAAIPGGLPDHLEEDIFFGRDNRLGARLMRASSSADVKISDAASARATSDGDVPSTSKPKKSYGCARPPPGYKPPIAAADDMVAHELLEYTPPVGKRLASTVTQGHPDSDSFRNDRLLLIELEKLWRTKTDLHGVGYNMSSGGASASKVPSNRRLYMSSQRGKNLNSKTPALGYGAFGTGVLDQDEYDVWEEVYDNSSDKHSQYHAALKDDDVDDEARAAALEDVRSSSFLRSEQTGAGELDGFVAAERPDKSPVDFSQWHPPRVPRGYRGIHLIEISPFQEATGGSKEHQQLLEFQEKYGNQRLVNPRYRAELLGEKGRASSTSQQKPSNQSAGAQESHPSSEPNTMAQSSEPSLTHAQPLWQGVSDDHKQNLLNALGRNFVMGQNQDMDGKAARHAPFKSDPQKQTRYSRFCMALEGKASASEALRDKGNLTKAEREAELAEFGRVYQSFKQQHPKLDIAVALDDHSDAKAVAPVLRRYITQWTPDKLLCKRWGVAEPRPSGFSDKPGAELPGAKQQRKYLEQVQAGLQAVAQKAPTPASSASPDADASSVADVLPHTFVAAGGALARPPKSLFASIFGDESDDDT